MANILDIRRRIHSVKNTRQITKAMKMVSAAKLRRAQERALAGRPYAQRLTSVLQSLGLIHEAATIEAAVKDAVVTGHGTKEIGGSLGTKETGDFIARAMQLS